MAAAKLEPTRTPGVYKRGGRYVVVWQHRGKQHKSFHRTYAEAREAKGRRQGGDRRPSSRLKFDEYVRGWLEGYAGRTSRGFSEQARRDYRHALEGYVIPFFAGARLDDIERTDVRRLVAALEARGLAPSSVVKYLTPLRAMFATALEDGVITENPCAGVRVNTRRVDASEEPEAKAMTRDELQAVLAHIPDRWSLLFELLAKTGLRISEALGLDWRDVEFGKRPRLKVRRQFYRGDLRQLKTQAGRRELPLSPGLSQALWVARPASATGPVFATRTGSRLSDSNVRRVLDAAADQAGLSWVHLHTFRHTCASMLFAAGKNIRQVCDFLGHADPAFTLRTYVHLIDGGLGDVDFLDAQVGKAWATEQTETTAKQTGSAKSKLAS